MNAYLYVLRNFHDFTDRADREEYWMFVLFNLIFSIAAAVLDNILGVTFGNSIYGPVYIAYSLFVFVPGLAVAVRRLHDTGRSGWMLLIGLIPIIGAIWLFVLLAMEGNDRDNPYGTSEVQNDNDGSFLTANKNSDSILIGVVAFILVSSAFWHIAPTFSAQFYEMNWYRYPAAVVGIISGALPAVLGMLIQKKNLRLAALVVGGAYFCFNMYKAVQMLIFSDMY
ncbi:MAG TPA: DUF805 domain-containing protein [Flavobacterium sp.]|jgi:uncharacterized membrane protein YhaH (DUF805 family)